MQVPMMTHAESTHHEASEPIRCVPVFKPTAGQQHTKEMMRYVVVITSILAVLLLVAIALYYTQGNFVTVKHVHLLTPHLPLVRAS